MPAVTVSEHELQALVRAGPAPALVEVPTLAFLMIDGRGDPNVSARYREAVQALYGVSYTLKFALKRAGRPDVRVAPLEGLWWVEDMARFGTTDKSEWSWTAMIRQPEEVTESFVAEAARTVAEKKRLPAALELRLELFTEGLVAQVLHVGPYAEEAPTIERLHAFIAGERYTMRGKHHEIYLGDPRRSAPERLRTVIRQPVAAA